MLTRVEKYEIAGVIGQGGMATVYRARDTRLEREVALKVMHPHLQRAKEARERFAREALSVARLKHPGILEIYDYSGEGSEVSYIATELLTGPTLKQFADEHPEIPAEIAACFIIAVARALKAAHAEGVIHRDVKPENVLIHQNREVKLTDFGIAQLVDAQSMTSTGQVLGSPGHMAPEQVEGKECTERSDLFSLGTVLYLLATGRLPFSGRNPHQVLKQIVDGKFLDPLQVRPSIGGTLRLVILRCLQVDPEQRYASAAELEAELTAFVKQIGIETPTEALADYLEDPEGYSEAIRARTLQHLIQAGERLYKKSEVTGAFDVYNRALALDDGNQQVLDALESIGRRARRRRMARKAAFGLLALLVAGAGGWAVSSDGVRSRLVGSLLAFSRPEASPVTGNAAHGPAQLERPPQPALKQPPAGRADRSRAKSSKPEGEAPRSAEAHRGTDPTRPRTVVFMPEPANVSISVDGSEPRAFGPSFRQIELEPGVHRFKLIGAHDCCIDEEITLRIPPGPGTTALKHRLGYRPAALYVVTNVPADVTVDDGRSTGRTRSVIKVPHEIELDELHEVKLQAPGYQEHDEAVEMRAGQLSTLKVTLVPVAGK
jgi:tRNA A-37 threonylcarbamoyl transferase component Bud32